MSLVDQLIAAVTEHHANLGYRDNGYIVAVMVMAQSHDVKASIHRRQRRARSTSPLAAVAQGQGVDSSRNCNLESI